MLARKTTVVPMIQSTWLNQESDSGESNCAKAHVATQAASNTIFVGIFRNIHGENEAGVMRHVSRLSDLSADTIAFRARQFKELTDGVNEGLTSLIALTGGARSQPEQSTKFRRHAFTNEQLAKL